MLRFKQFIKETPSYMDPNEHGNGKEGNTIHKDNYVKPNHHKDSGFRKTTKLSSHGEYDLYKHHAGYGSNAEDTGSTYHHFSLVHRATDETHMHVAGNLIHHDGKKKFQVDSLVGHEHSKVKAHEFYHHILHHVDELHSDTIHSKGGMTTWKHLATKHPDVEVHHQLSHFHGGEGGEHPVNKHDWMSHYRDSKQRPRHPNHTSNFVARLKK